MFHLMRKPTFLGILVISTLLLAACGTASAQPANPTAAPAQTQPPAAAPTTSSSQSSASPASPTAAPAQTQPPAAAPTTSSSQSAQGPVVVVKNTALGNILTSSDGLTLYIFTTDKPDQTSCTDGCAQVWPPLTVPQGVTPTAGPGVTGTVGVFQRPDGTYQVTINKMPVYHYSGDAQPGETNGQGLFGKWYVVDPAGNPITTTSASSGSGGY